jgi:hypothetical protein
MRSCDSSLDPDDVRRSAQLPQGFSRRDEIRSMIVFDDRAEDERIHDVLL